MADPAQDNQPKSATQAAKQKIAEAVATLHEALRPFANKKAREFFSYYASQEQYNGTVKKLSDDGFIPHSTRFKFELVGSKRVSEGAEFATLKAESTAIVKEFQLKLRDKIRSAADLEGKALRKVASKTMIDATVKMAEAFLTEYSAAVVDKKELLALSLSVLSSDELMGVVRPWCDDVPALKTELKNVIGCEGNPAQLIGAKHLLVSRLRKAIYALFIKPGMAYGVYIEAEKKKSRLTNLMKETAQTEANAAVMELTDAEASATPDTIERIVEKKVKQALAKHTKQFGKHESSLKEQGGPNKDGIGASGNQPEPNKRKGTPSKQTKYAKKQAPPAGQNHVEHERENDDESSKKRKRGGTNGSKKKRRGERKN